MSYWLLKTEPHKFSIDNLKKSGVEPWDGIRNYQARNFMRDSMKIGDGVFIYHSQVQPVAVVGQGEVASQPYPDPTQFDPRSEYFDPKSRPDAPRWVLVDIRYVCHFPRPVPLSELKQTPGLEKMVVTQKGSRLSIQPVRATEWRIVRSLAGFNP